jgi:hypothetical protein
MNFRFKEQLLLYLYNIAERIELLQSKRMNEDCDFK